MLRIIAAALTGALFLPLIHSVQAADLSEIQHTAADVSRSNSRAQSAGRHKIGYGRLIGNDLIGDGKDRWRTGSVTVSRIYGYGWNGVAPRRFGELLELRIQGQIIAPASLKSTDPTDRPWSGALSVGLHSYMQRGNTDFALGADLVVIGPQTQLDHFQGTLHDLLQAPRPSDAMLALQVPDKVRPTVVAEVGQTYDWGAGLSLRPFAEARAGDESLVRIGADLTFGGVGRGELLIRESVSGQRYRSVYQSGPGYSFTIGGDIAYVAESVYLPKDRGLELTSHRDRLRAGVHWQGRNASAFYGLTYLGREFAGQGEGQVTGSLRLKLRF